MQVLGGSEPPTKVWIRWPGGTITTAPVPAGSHEISVDTDGETIVNR